MSLIRSICDMHDRTTDLGYLLSVLALFLMLAIYCAEVVSRYFLGATLAWSNDTFSNLMAVSIFAMLPHVTRASRHISINLIEEMVPSAGNILRILTSLVGVVVCSFLAWMALQENFRQSAMGILTSQNYPIPMVWVSGFLTFGFFSTALYYLRALFAVQETRPRTWVNAIGIDADKK